MKSITTGSIEYLLFIIFLFLTTMAINFIRCILSFSSKNIKTERFNKAMGFSLQAFHRVSKDVQYKV